MLATALFPHMSGATYSPCKRYRYTLWRQWDADKPHATFVMLNPSTATELENDPTVERCQRRALKMGYGGLRVANIFAFRSTNPKGIYEVADPVGPDNDAAILSSVQDAGIVIASWGFHGEHLGRAARVMELLKTQGVQVHCLGMTQDGYPRHPLYVSYEATPMPYVGKAEAQNGA